MSETYDCKPHQKFKPKLKLLTFKVNANEMLSPTPFSFTTVNLL